MAKKVRGSDTSPGSSEELDDPRRRRSEKAARIDLVIRWSEYPMWIELHDPTTGEWHEVRASECLPEVVETANKHRKKGGAA